MNSPGKELNDLVSQKAIKDNSIFFLGFIDPQILLLSISEFLVKFPSTLWHKVACTRNGDYDKIRRIINMFV